MQRNDVQPIEEVFAERAVRDGRGRSRCVAATTRMSIAVARSAPSGIAPAARAAASPASRRACRRSRRKSVPPSASTSRPARSACAPVNAPRRCPNNSLSSRSAGIAAQFTATNGPHAGPMPHAARGRPPLARARLAGQEHGRVAHRGAADLLLHVAHRGAHAQQPRSVRRRLAREIAVARRECGRLIRRHDAVEQLRDVATPDRLRQVIECAEPHRFDRVVAGRMGRQHDDRNRGQRGIVAQLREASPSRSGRQKSRKMHSTPPPSRSALRGAAGGGLDGPMTEIGERFGEAVAKGRVVVDYEDVCHGISITNAAPRRGARARRAPPPLRARRPDQGPCPPSGPSRTARKSARAARPARRGRCSTR